MDLRNLPVPSFLPLLGNKECATKGRAEGSGVRRVREHDYCLLLSSGSTEACLFLDSEKEGEWEEE